MDIELYQKFLYTVCFGYFGVKIYYKSLFTNFKIKNSHEELVDFSVTCVMASIVYLITNFYYPMNNSIYFYLGFLVGTQIIVFKKIILPINDDSENNTWNDILFYTFIIIYAIVFIYFYIIQNIGIKIMNPLIIIIGIISIIIGLILTSGTTTSDTADSSGLNPNLGFMAFLGSLLFINTPSTNTIITFFQSILIGVFVSDFSYNGPRYLIDKKHDLNSPLNKINITNDTSDKDITDLLTTINTSNNEITGLNSNLMTYNKNFNTYCNFKNDIETGKIVSGLSYITVLIIITVVYINLKDNNMV